MRAVKVSLAIPDPLSSCQHILVQAGRIYSSPGMPKAHG